MKRDFSPEEKLLNLIKKKRVKAHPERMHATEEAVHIEKPVKRSEPTSAESITWLTRIKFLNSILFSLLVAMIFYLVIDLFMIKDAGLEQAGDVKVIASGPVADIESRPSSYYIESLKARQLFKTIASDKGDSSVSGIAREELIANLELLGIVSGENPQAIIEDKARKKSYFLREGQAAGGIHLKTIDANGVTVVYGDEEFNLSI